MANQEGLTKRSCFARDKNKSGTFGDNQGKQKVRKKIKKKCALNLDRSGGQESSKVYRPFGRRVLFG
jgi:SET domain-containing protein